MLARALNHLLPILRRTKLDHAAKQAFELAFWTKEALMTLPPWGDRVFIGVYEPCFTTSMGLNPEQYTGKKLLDIGCGPLGTLEWADKAAERVGLDPLAAQYRMLGTRKHKMKYVTAPSEAIPFDDGYFDIVSCFNALDHVDNLENTVMEIKRVVKPGGLFLLGVDTNHEPTLAEPIMIDWNITRKFAPEFVCEYERRYEKTSNNYNLVVERGQYFDYKDDRARPGVIFARFRRNTTDSQTACASRDD